MQAAYNRQVAGSSPAGRITLSYRAHYMKSRLEMLKRRLYVDNHVRNFKSFAGTDADVSSEDEAREVNKFFASVERSALPRFSIRKINKCLHIMDGDTSCYSPPNFIQLPNRAALQQLVDAFNETNCRSIDAIVAFESKHVRRRNSGRTA